VCQSSSEDPSAFVTKRRAYHIKPVVTDAVKVVYCIKARAAAGEESMREKNSKTARGH
jgi:hypothetical protein